MDQWIEEENERKAPSKSGAADRIIAAVEREFSGPTEEHISRTDEIAELNKKIKECDHKMRKLPSVPPQRRMKNPELTANIKKKRDALKLVKYECQLRLDEIRLETEGKDPSSAAVIDEPETQAE